MSDKSLGLVQASVNRLHISPAALIAIILRSLNEIKAREKRRGARREEMQEQAKEERRKRK